jgi:hypothetical protein
MRAAAIVAIALALAAVLWLRATPRPETSGWFAPWLSPPRRCSCVSEMRPVCRGRRAWPSECEARCDGVVDAEPCIGAPR